MNDKTDIKNWHILIVDDDDDNLGVAAEYLEFLGATICTAKDGIKGLEELKTFSPTLILMDLSMPKMDGWTMFKKVREQKKFTDVPIIAVTAHAMPADRERVMEAGFNGYITKPFMLATLPDEIKKWLKDKPQTGSNDTKPENAS